MADLLFVDFIVGVFRFFFFQAEDGIRDDLVTGVQTCALPISDPKGAALLTELARRKIGPDAVIAIFFTHGHRDHTAGASLCPNAALYALDADVEIGRASCRERV